MNIFEKGDISFDNFTSLSHEELKEVLDWRNHESVRKQMYTNDVIGLEDHLAFVRSLNHAKDKMYFRVKWKDNAIGVVDYYHIRQDSAFWGFYLNPELIGSAWGIYLEYLVIEYVFEVLKLNTLYGEILDSNEVVLKIHHFFNFKTTGTRENIVDVMMDKETWEASKQKIKPMIKILPS